MTNVKVSLVKSKNHTGGVQKSLELLKNDLEKSLSKISSIVIKINLVDNRVDLANTPFLAVKSFIDFISPFYRKEIIIIEGPTFGTKIDGFQKYGYAKLAKENLQVKTLTLKEDGIIERRVKYPEGELILPFSKTIMEAPFLVSITRPKTHNVVVVTAGIKNVLIGAISGGYRARLKAHKGKFIHHVMASIAQHVYPGLAIIDGTIGMEGDGPVGNGTAIKAGWALASLDALTADSLAAYLMGFNIDDIGYLNLLHEKSFGALYPKDKIEVKGEKPSSLITPFKPHKTFEKRRKWR